jgi:hypothetical protein
VKIFVTTTQNKSMSFTLDRNTMLAIVGGGLIGMWLSKRVGAEPELFASSSDDMMMMGDDMTPPATAPLASEESMPPVMTLGARQLGGRQLGGSLLGNLRPRRVYNDMNSNNPGAYRPAMTVPFSRPTPAPTTPAAKPALKPAAAAVAKPKGASLTPKPAKALKTAAFLPEIDSRDGLIVQPFR